MFGERKCVAIFFHGQWKNLFCRFLKIRIIPDLRNVSNQKNVVLLPFLCFIVSFKNISKRKQWSGLVARESTTSCFFVQLFNRCYYLIIYNNNSIFDHSIVLSSKNNCTKLLTKHWITKEGFTVSVTKQLCYYQVLFLSRQKFNLTTICFWYFLKNVFMSLELISVYG